MTVCAGIARLIRAYAEEDPSLSNREIARRAKVSVTTVFRYRNADYTPKTTRASRKAVSDRRKHVEKAASARGGAKTGRACLNPTPAAIRNALPPRFRNVSLSTIANDLVALNFVSRVRPKVVNNDSKKNAKRLAFAKKQLANIDRTLDRHVFTDEAWVNNNDNTHRREFVRGALRKQSATKSKKGKSNARTAARRSQLKAVQSPSARVHMKQTAVKALVWGSIGIDFKGPLVVLRKTVTAPIYQQEMLPKLLRNLKGKILVQDNARPHTAKATQEFLAKRKVEVLDGWPPYSPHLNPIEKLWSMLHRRVAKMRPTTVAEVERCAREVWREISQDTINNLIRGYEKALQRTVRQRGIPW